MPDAHTVLDTLDQHGYRRTAPRQAVVEAVLRREEPFTSAELWDTVHQQAPAVGRATVFRTLDLLVRLGLVQRIHADAESGRCHAYLACDLGHHHHLICSGCGTVADFHEDRAFARFLRQIEQQTAFRVEGHRLELLGRCPECQAADRA